MSGHLGFQQEPFENVAGDRLGGVVSSGHQQWLHFWPGCPDLQQLDVAAVSTFRQNARLERRIRSILVEPPTGLRACIVVCQISFVHTR